MSKILNYTSSHPLEPSLFSGKIQKVCMVPNMKVGFQGARNEIPDRTDSEHLTSRVQKMG